MSSVNPGPVEQNHTGSPAIQSTGSHGSSNADGAERPRKLKACTNCRKAKVRCQHEGKAPCKRCESLQLECFFPTKIPTSIISTSAISDPGVVDRRWMDVIETRLGKVGRTLDSILQLLAMNPEWSNEIPAGLSMSTAEANPNAGIEMGTTKGMGSSGDESEDAQSYSMGNYSQLDQVMAAAFQPSPTAPELSGVMDKNDPERQVSSNIPSRDTTDNTRHVGKARRVSIGSSLADTHFRSKSVEEPPDMSLFQEYGYHDDMGSIPRFVNDTDGGLASLPFSPAEFSTPESLGDSTIPFMHFSKPIASASPNSRKQKQNHNISQSESKPKQNLRISEPDFVPPPCYNAEQTILRFREELSVGFQPKGRSSLNSRRDLRYNGLITFDQAAILFSFFHAKVSTYFFSFDITKHPLEKAWHRSPIFVAAICSVAAMRHPQLSHLYFPLKDETCLLVKDMLFDLPSDRDTAVETIIALTVAGFWLPGCKMFTALAHQLCVSWNIIIHFRGTQDSLEGVADCSSSEIETARVWGLVYILDGQNMLAYNSAPLISRQDQAPEIRRVLLGLPEAADQPQDNQFGKPILIRDPLSHSESKDNEKFQRSAEFLQSNVLLADKELVAQIEYVYAVKSLFDEQQWRFINSSGLAVRWQTNLELDRWVVCWACVLSSNSESMFSWASKSTFMQYNFAKMFINSTTLGKLRSGVVDTSHSRHENMAFPGQYDDSRKGLNAETSDTIYDEIARDAAATLLDMVVNDKDVIDALPYVPSHITIMLLYAVLLILGAMEEPKARYSCQNYTGSPGQYEYDEQRKQKHATQLHLVQRFLEIIKCSSSTPPEVCTGSMGNKSYGRNFMHRQEDIQSVVACWLQQALGQKIEELQQTEYGLWVIEHCQKAHTGKASHTPVGWPGSTPYRDDRSV